MISAPPHHYSSSGKVKGGKGESSKMINLANPHGSWRREKYVFTPNIF